ncbi:Inner membrane protein YbaN [Pseudovibrio axinellae]|uniref:Inner membrane protein YbaN n=1 Tax=Pseudovibrio axinellae TaxID=989403 RepID=A0A165UNI2_9HYPH|nr:YbaN family protein [Pseudovibrio axinellae]KZL12610.1 Inner membrane protein YbaN [Pseudovibrio axinellae]SEP64575.1 hypothetical protein SAMN05421798_10164 [Pseudovibrio axinellae]
MKKLLYLIFGLALVATGIVGIFLPLLPTTIFFILAAGCFARSSPRLESWILTHPKIGPSVIYWQEHRAIPKKAKFFAFSGLIFGYLMFLKMSHPNVLLAIAVALMVCAVAGYIASRPSKPIVT